jgi:hypothetical protein
MKKIFSILFYFGFSFVCIFVSFKILSYIEIGKLFPGRVKNGCWELDQCDFSTIYYFYIIVKLITPIIVFSIIGYKQEKNIFSNKTFKNIIFLFLGTLLFYLSTGILHEWLTTR